MNAAPPDCAEHRSAEVVENLRIARDTYRLRLADPRMARAILPGQFVMIRPTRSGATDPFFGRPFALYDTLLDASGAPEAIDIVYLVLGRGTAALAERRAGDRLDYWGPLGNGFGPPPEGGRVTMVAGGIGQTPLLALGRAWLGGRSYGGAPPAPPAASVELLFGVRNAEYAAGLDDFRAAGIDVSLATDDGSDGHRGLVTDLLESRLRDGRTPSKLVGCGPPGMLAALARIADRLGIPCIVSLENQMACGFGACFSCVVPLRRDAGPADLRRVCVEGPVFPADEVSWPDLAPH